MKPYYDLLKKEGYEVVEAGDGEVSEGCLFKRASLFDYIRSNVAKS